MGKRARKQIPRQKVPPKKTLPVPEYIYFPSAWAKRYGPNAWARVRFMNACIHLKIPKKKWPKFALETSIFSHPPRFQLLPAIKFIFEPLPFDFVIESPTEWRKKTESAFSAYCDDYIQRCVRAVDEMIAAGLFEKMPIIRDKNTPIDLRYEWAAQRYCLKKNFKELSSDQHKTEKIRKTVGKILLELGLTQRK
jgi:hypothetical protein